MTMVHQRLSLLAGSCLILGLGGCQHLERFAEWAGFHAADHSVKVTPVPVNAPPPTANAREDALYEQAVAAIEQRDYGRALDVLQLAREARENDPRVLSAMGVVYDKLGRFDLSKRYYDLADAADPGSKVVAQDRAYSLVLQQRIAAERAPDEVVLAETPAVTRLASAPAAVTVQAASATPPPSILGGVLVQNATGVPSAGKAIRADLVRKGWTVYRTISETRVIDAITLVQFPMNADRASEASALAHTLTFPVRLEACASCRMLKLTLGTDALRHAKADQSLKGPRA
jgi:tetratricopeptide (TPR) repeat protein